MSTETFTTTELSKFSLPTESMPLPSAGLDEDGSLSKTPVKYAGPKFHTTSPSPHALPIPVSLLKGEVSKEGALSSSLPALSSLKASLVKGKQDQSQKPKGKENTSDSENPFMLEAETLRKMESEFSERHQHYHPKTSATTNSSQQQYFEKSKKGKDLENAAMSSYYKYHQRPRSSSIIENPSRNIHPSLRESNHANSDSDVFMTLPYFYNSKKPTSKYEVEQSGKKPKSNKLINQGKKLNRVQKDSGSPQHPVSILKRPDQQQVKSQLGAEVGSSNYTTDKNFKGMHHHYSPKTIPNDNTKDGNSNFNYISSPTIASYCQPLEPHISKNLDEISFNLKQMLKIVNSPLS